MFDEPEVAKEEVVTKSILILPANRKPYKLLNPLKQAGIELKAGDTAQLTDSQVERLRPLGVIA